MQMIGNANVIVQIIGNKNAIVQMIGNANAIVQMIAIANAKIFSQIFVSVGVGWQTKSTKCDIYLQMVMRAGE